MLSGLSLLVISGCIYPISKELRQEAKEDLTFSMVLQNPKAYIGSIVLWGGKIIETINVPDGMEIIVLEMPLDYGEMPEDERRSRGRFIAKSSKFLDPAIYKEGRKITLAGEIIGSETKPLGKTQYTYPVVMIKQLHLWRKQRPVSPPPYYWGWGWYGPYGPYLPYYYWPYQYRLEHDWD